jgi:hypothetical protein
MHCQSSVVPPALKLHAFIDPASELAGYWHSSLRDWSISSRHPGNPHCYGIVRERAPFDFSSSNLR